MFIHLFYFESKSLWRNPFFGLLLFLLTVFFAFATFNGAERTKQQQKQLSTVKELEDKFYTKQYALLDSIEKGLRKAPEEWYRNPENPLVVAAFRGAGVYATLAPSNLSIISTGQSDIFPYYSKVAIGKTNAAKDNENFENPMSTAIGQFDIAFVIAFILPLLAIAFAYNCLSAEREQGILPLLLSMPLPINYVVLVKVGFRYCFTTLTSCFLLITLLLIYKVSLNIDLLFLSVAIALYLLFWFGIALFINLLGKSSAINAMLLLGCWLAFTVIIPSTANLLANTLYPIPSRVEFVTALRQADIQTEKQEKQILQQFYAKNPQFKQLPATEQTWRDSWRENFVIEAYKQSLKDSIQQHFTARATQQRQFAQLFTYVSPTIYLQNSLNKMARTDTNTYLEFQRQVALFEKKWSLYFKTKFMQEQKMTTADWKEFPAFNASNVE
jgi:ABC-2 type transport system permease protein